MLLISGTPLSRENEMGQNRDALLATGGKEAAGFGCPSSSHQETNTFNDTNSTNIDHTFLSFMIMGMFFLQNSVHLYKQNSSVHFTLVHLQKYQL